MKAIIIEEYGDASVLKEADVDVPKIKADQVLLEVYATSVNPIDWKIREGYLKDGISLDFPIILGWDAAGIVKEVGNKVTSVKPGDRIFTRPATTSQGTYAEYVPVDESRLAKLPDSISFTEAAAVPLAGLTAWQCLFDFGKLQKDQKVLIHAGSGGVGSFTIQFAKHAGAYVATTASEKNKALVHDLGADQFINYNEEDFEKVLSNYDLVVDTLGGDILDKSMNVLRSGGKLVSVSGQPDQEKAKQKDIEADFLWLRENGKQLAEIASLMESGKVKSVIGSYYPLTAEGLKEAHQLSETGHSKGKIVIEVKK
ncbi:NADP-dependent oxidoreductase [Oceanobacillus sp. J11TS1]|uniref:NADP-dependent oxidoreductase n=1 Tax=Oceanobacillus sp. J11TS1 TaxID=2807191 RepID=UPI001B17D73B|nr:NADP-dependent oxidoreductase [Oceanobacillus sp. J11TS1]GIO22901.1 NADPH:quinone reductase [Oceanobacillus sp. J11TS1]